MRWLVLLAFVAFTSCRCAEPLKSDCSNGDVKDCRCDDGRAGLEACVGGFFTACVCDATDGGVPGDAGFADAGFADAGFTDAGFTDAGFTDAGFADAGFVDGGPVVVHATNVKIPSGSGAASSTHFKARVRVGAPPGTPAQRSP